MQPDKPHFSGGIALLISLLMTAGSILLCVPLYVSAEVRKKILYHDIRYLVVSTLNTFYISL